jgi:integrase
MFKGAVYCRKWIHEGKKRKAWGIRYSVNGGAVKREIVADTKDAAQTELNKKREDYQNRLIGVAEGKTLADLATPYRDYQKAKEHDLVTIEARLKNLLAYFGTTALEDIEERADAYVLARRAAGVVNSTINREIAVLNHMLHLAWRRFKMLRHRPFIERLTEAGPRERELSEAEEAKLLAVCGQDIRDLIEAGLMTGMREGELLALTRAQVDLAERLINFPPTKKGLKRLMPINERLYYLLCRRCACLSPDALVFSLASQPWQRWHIRNRLAVAIRKAGIPAIRFHDLRHTAASRLRRAGADMDHIRKVLGHRGIQTTQGYVHYEAEQLRPILALLGTPAASTNLTQERVPVATGSANLLN